jgi:hypothetical protein
MILRSSRSRFAVFSACSFFVVVVFIITSGTSRSFQLRFSPKSVLYPNTTTSASTSSSIDRSRQTASQPISPEASSTRIPGIYYKTTAPAFQYTAFPIVEHFARAAQTKSPDDLPPVPSWNTPPAVHVQEPTPLFIGFTRNWPLLQQVVVGYITAGWPPEGIYVVENTGTMLSNAKRLLNESNPFYLDHHRFKNVLGENLLITPALLSFAQLQTLYLFEAVSREWPHYFWSHMDVLPQSWEDRAPYKSLYSRAVDVVRECLAPGYARDAAGREHRWGLRYLSYDWLSLINTATMLELGGWDPMVP